MSPAHLVRCRDELAPHLHVLAKHTFGNWLVSRLAEFDVMHAAIVAAFEGHVVELICHAQGSRVIQAVLAVLPTSADGEGLAAKLLHELQGHVTECALDTHGSWGVCAAFSRFSGSASFVLDEVSQNVVELSRQQHGCRVVQSVLQAAADAGLDVSDAVEGIIGRAQRGSELEANAMHRFANYAVQVALRIASNEQRGVMLATLLPRLLQLAASKHGSNVAELVVSLASAEQVAAVAEGVFGDSTAAAASLSELMAHQFGNYVLQKLLRRLAGGDSGDYHSALHKVRDATSADNYGRSILSRAEGGSEDEAAGKAA